MALTTEERLRKVENFMVLIGKEVEQFKNDMRSVTVTTNMGLAAIQLYGLSNRSTDGISNKYSANQGMPGYYQRSTIGQLNDRLNDLEFTVISLMEANSSPTVQNLQVQSLVQGVESSVLGFLPTFRTIVNKEAEVRSNFKRGISLKNLTEDLDAIEESPTTIMNVKSPTQALKPGLPGCTGCFGQMMSDLARASSLNEYSTTYSANPYLKSAPLYRKSVYTTLELKKLIADVHGAYPLSDGALDECGYLMGLNMCETGAHVASRMIDLRDNQGSLHYSEIMSTPNYEYHMVNLAGLRLPKWYIDNAKGTSGVSSIEDKIMRSGLVLGHAYVVCYFPSTPTARQVIIMSVGHFKSTSDRIMDLLLGQTLNNQVKHKTITQIRRDQNGVPMSEYDPTTWTQQWKTDWMTGYWSPTIEEVVGKRKDVVLHDAGEINCSYALASEFFDLQEQYDKKSYNLLTNNCQHAASDVINFLVYFVKPDWWNSHCSARLLMAYSLSKRNRYKQYVSSKIAPATNASIESLSARNDGPSSLFDSLNNILQFLPVPQSDNNDPINAFNFFQEPSVPMPEQEAVNNAVRQGALQGLVFEKCALL